MLVYLFILLQGIQPITYPGGSSSSGGVSYSFQFGAAEVTPPAPSFDSDAQDYFDRIVTAGSDISDTQKLAINTFVLVAKGSNVSSVNFWTNLVEVYPLAGTNLTAALVKLKYASTNSSVLTNSSMVATNYSELRGIKGTTGRYLITGYNFLDFGNNGGLSFFLNENDVATPLNSFLIGTSLTAPPATILWNIANNISYGLGNNSATPYATKMFGAGLYHVARETSTKAVFRVGGVNIATNATASSGTRDTVITVFAGGGTSASTNWGSFAAIDDGIMGDTKAELFAQAVDNLNYDLGRVTQAPYPMNYIGMSGQSLSIGLAGGANLSVTQTNQNRLGDTYRVSPNGSIHYVGSLPLLVEFGVETFASGFANTLMDRSKSAHAGSETNAVTIASFGVNATAYSGLAKGTTPYNNSLNAISNAFRLSRNTRNGFIVRAMMIKHGEADNINANYQANIETWQSDYETDIRAITGQSQYIPMYHSQVSSWGKQLTTTNLSTFAMLAAYEKLPTTNIVCNPDYFFTFQDGLHLTNTSYRWLGEFRAKAYYTNNILGQRFWPLYWTNIVRTNAEIYLRYPTGVDLVMDTTAVSDPGDNGFEILESAETISSVELIIAEGSTITNAVKITLSGSPSGGRFAYAFTTTSGSNGGPTTGPRGNLKRPDSNWTSIYGNNLDDWALHQVSNIP